MGSAGHHKEERTNEMAAGSDPLADELARELLQARLIANLATFKSDGSIHLVAMWFL
jgi:hypothetical protein